MDSVRVWIDAVSWECIDKKILSLNSTHSKGTEVVGFNYIPFPTTSIILKKIKKRLDSYRVLLVSSTIRDKEKIMKKKKTKEYTDEQLGYFQYMNDKDEFMVDDVQDMDYIDHLMGGVANPYDGLDMDTSFDELDESSDWFMD